MDTTGLNFVSPVMSKISSKDFTKSDTIEEQEMAKTFSYHTTEHSQESLNADLHKSDRKKEISRWYTKDDVKTSPINLKDGSENPPRRRMTLRAGKQLP